LEIAFESVFFEVAALLLLSALFGVAALLLKQPLIVAFVAVGIVAGPAWLHLITADEAVELLASMGIALLLFIVGLRLDLQVVRALGKIALLIGAGQMLLVAGLGFAVCQLLGFSRVHALYVAVALSFSSTIIVVKLLSDQREIDALHGRIAVGVLIVQDIAVILVMIGLSAFGDAGDDRGYLAQVLAVVGKAALALAAIGLLMRFVLPPLMRLLAHSPELLVLGAMAWALTLAAGGEALGFSKEVGAFVAGVSLASAPFREALGARLASLRDFLLLFFFLSLGASLDLSLTIAGLGNAIVLSLMVLIGKPLVVMAIMGILGYRKRVSVLTGISLAQISEFSLILGALGLRLGHLDAESLGTITLVGLITLTLSSYLILYSHIVYERLAPALGAIERKAPYREREDEAAAEEWDCIVFGLGRYGSALARNLEHVGLRVLGVDFDPEAVAAWRRQGGHARYGDAEDPEFAAALSQEPSACVVSTTPHVATNLTLLQALRQRGYRGAIVLTAHHRADAATLQRAGASVVLRPFFDAAERAAEHLAAIAQGDRGVSTRSSPGAMPRPDDAEATRVS
jgi:Kef-type K+ transport system membrane component KefB